jgi:enamine deaminase RidA (YjgF/YER057c/UK114 family)
VLRQSIEIEGFGHQNPIPAASRIGPLLVSSVVAPMNPGTRDVPEDMDSQIANLFTHVGRILEAGGAGWDDVAKMTFFVSTMAFRDAINAPWVERFPDAEHRPARHTLLVPSGSSRPTVTCEVMAFVGSGD